jgi:hypothetical protein
MPKYSAIISQSIALMCDVVSAKNSISQERSCDMLFPLLC